MLAINIVRAVAVESVPNTVLSTIQFVSDVFGVLRSGLENSEKELNHITKEIYYVSITGDIAN